MTHAISPFWMILGLIETLTRQLQMAKWVRFAAHPMEAGPPPSPAFLS